MSERSLSQPGNLYSVKNCLRAGNDSSTEHKFIDGRILSSDGLSRQHNLSGTKTTASRA